MHSFPSTVTLNKFLQTRNCSPTGVDVGVHVAIGVLVGVAVLVLVGVAVP